MRRILAAFVVGVAALTLTLSGAAAQDKKKDDKEKSPTTKQIMAKSFGKKAPLKGQVDTAAKAEKYEDLAKAGTEWKKLGEALTKNSPPKGDKDSWDKLTKEFSDATAAVAKAGEDKDGKAALEATGKIGKSCKACHDAHK